MSNPETFKSLLSFCQSVILKGHQYPMEYLTTGFAE